MNHLINVLTRFYTYLLYLYPSAFHAAYADEMVAVFRMKMQDTVQRGWFAL